MKKYQKILLFAFVLLSVGYGIARAQTVTNGNVGIKTDTAVSTFEVAGSMGSEIQKITSTTTLSGANQTILCDATSAAVVVTLPSVSSAFNSTSSVGRVYDIKKIDSSINTCTITAGSGDTIDGASTQTLVTQYQSKTVQSAGSNAWYLK